MPEVTLRPVTMNDADLLLAWRNDPVTRAMFVNSDIVARESHIAWLSNVLAGTQKELLITELDGTAIGTVRFDAGDESMFELSVTIAPEQRGKGLGYPMEKAAVAHMFHKRPDAIVVGRIKPSNFPALRIVEKLGFKIVGRDRDSHGVGELVVLHLVNPNDLHPLI
jgi:RimJ/RimL family protein N-acetyltransferase